MQDTSSVLTVGDVVTRVRQRPVLAVAPVMLGLLLAVAYVVLTPPSFSATASVKVEPVVADRYAGNINVQNLISMQTEMQVAQSTEVASIAAEALKLDVRTIRRSISVNSPQDTQVMNISFSAASPRAAADGALTVAQSYLDYRKASAQQVAKAQLAAVEEDIVAVEKRIAVRSTAALQTQLETLNASKRSLDLLLANNAGELINKPAEPESPSAPKPLVAVAGGVGLGVIAGLVLSVLWPNRRRRATAPVPPRMQRPGAVQRAVVPGARPGVRPGVRPVTPAQAAPLAPPVRPTGAPSAGGGRPAGTPQPPAPARRP